MADRIVTTAYWNNEDVQGLNGYERAIYLYLITAPNSALCGLYETTVSDISHYSGWSIKRVQASLQTLSEKGKIVFDNGIMFVKKLSDGQHAQKFGGFKHHVSKVNRDLKKPQNEAYRQFYDKFRTLLEPFENPSPTVPELHLKNQKKEPFPKGSRTLKEKEKENINFKQEEGSGGKPSKKVKPETDPESRKIMAEIKEKMGMKPKKNNESNSLENLIPQALEGITP